MPPGGAPNNFSTRPRISAAALLVKVTAKMARGRTRIASMRYPMRRVSTRVLPLPAPANTNNGPADAVTAARCASFRPVKIGELCIAKTATLSRVALTQTICESATGFFLVALDCRLRNA